MKIQAAIEAELPRERTPQRVAMWGVGRRQKRRLSYLRIYKGRTTENDTILESILASKVGLCPGPVLRWSQMGAQVADAPKSIVAIMAKFHDFH